MCLVALILVRGRVRDLQTEDLDQSARDQSSAIIS